MTIKIRIQVTVPAPGSIRVRVMSGAGTVINTIFVTFADLVSAGIGMGMEAGAIPGYREVVGNNESQFQRRDNGSNGEKLL